MTLPSDFAHLLPAAGDKAVIHHLVGVFNLGRHEHRLPHNGLKAHLVLARHLHDLALLPKLFKVALFIGPAKVEM
jgi:hypothetical protein